MKSEKNLKIMSLDSIFDSSKKKALLHIAESFSKNPKLIEKFIKNEEIVMHFRKLADLILKEMDYETNNIDFLKLISSIITVDVYFRLNYDYLDEMFDAFPVMHTKYGMQFDPKCFIQTSRSYKDYSARDAMQFVGKFLLENESISNHCIFSAGDRSEDFCYIHFFDITMEEFEKYSTEFINSVPSSSFIKISQDEIVIAFSKASQTPSVSINRNIYKTISHCLHSIPRNIGYYKFQSYATLRGLFQHIFDYKIVLDNPDDQEKMIINPFKKLPVEDLNPLQIMHSKPLRPWSHSEVDLFEKMLKQYHLQQPLDIFLSVDEFLSGDFALPIDVHQVVDSLLLTNSLSYNWLPYSILLFKEDAGVFTSMLLESYKRLDKDEKITMNDFELLKSFMNPYLEKLEKNVLENLKHACQNRSRHAQRSKKIKCCKWDEEMRPLVNVGIPWSKKKLLWLIYKKPGKIFIPNKEIILLIEKAYVENEMFEVLQVFNKYSSGEAEMFEPEKNFLNNRERRPFLNAMNLVPQLRELPPSPNEMNLNPQILPYMHDMHEGYFY